MRGLQRLLLFLWLLWCLKQRSEAKGNSGFCPTELKVGQISQSQTPRGSSTNRCRNTSTSVGSTGLPGSKELMEGRPLEARLSKLGEGSRKRGNMTHKNKNKTSVMSPACHLDSRLWKPKHLAKMPGCCPQSSGT